MLRCSFTNASSQVQVVKHQTANWERTIMPGQRVAFQAQQGDFLEIYTCQWCANLLADRIPCEKLSTSTEEMALL